MSAMLHQALFVLMSLVGIAELVLSAILLKRGDDNHDFPSHKFHNLLIYFLVTSGWTIFFATAYAYWIISQSMHFLASVATSLWWLCLTSALWGVAAGLFHNTRPGGICDGLPSISPCRESLTVEALGWTEFGLCLFTILATWHWVHSEEERSWRGSWVSQQPREAA